MFTGENMVSLVRTQATEGVWTANTQKAVYDFAVANSIGQRNASHLIWHQTNPAWFDAITTASALRAKLNAHIPVVMNELPQLAGWNVVNEVIHTVDNQPGGWRNTSIYQAFGANWPSEWFKFARTVAPTAELAWTDNHAIEDATSAAFDAVKAAIIWALDDGAPINSFGAQMHLETPVRNASAAQMVDRLGQIAALGLDIRLTEADVSDGSDYVWRLSTRRVDQVAHVESLLGPIFAQVPAVKSLNFWTVTDSESWLNGFLSPRTDGLRGEYSPFGRDGIIKPEWWAMFERITRP